MSDPKMPRKATSKFKPAIAGLSGSASSTAATRRTTPSDPLSAPSFARKSSVPHPVSRDTQMSDSPSQPLPMKRLASASSSRAAEGSPSKRFKPAVSPSIDHAHRRSPSKRLAPARQCSLQEAESVEFSPRPLPPIPSRLPLQRMPTPQSTSTDFLDLGSKSFDDLSSLLASDQALRTSIAEMIFHHIHNTQTHDIMMLSFFLSQIDDRIRAIHQRLPPPEVIEQSEDPSRLSPVPFAMPLASTSTSPPVQLDTRHTPPSSMDTSSSSASTLNTSATASITYDVTNDTPMTIDSPELAALDLHDASTATLVPDNTEDPFDQIPDDDDLLFFDTNKSGPSAPSTSTPVASSTSVPLSTVATSPAGRIDHTSTPYYKEVISILKNTFKLSTFRTNQLECIVATLDAKDVFYLAPTGGGKSLCFQLPALCVTGKTQGTTFVISPLISLINDQVAALRKKGVHVYPLTSAAEENDVRQAMRMMRSNAEDKPKLVYTTPERLQKSDCLRDVVNQLYEEKQLARFVIDEAHVIGSWGRDFRASYAELNILRKNWPNVPIMALTGSANKDAIEDIKRNLAMRNPVCLAQSFNRPNLHYSVRKKPSAKKELVQNIAGFIKTNHPNDTGIIYALSRADSEEMAKKLREDFGIEARHYHAGVNNEERKVNQDDWMAGRCKVIVATIAFGMGIDKPDVRFVIHATLSKDMDGYYQETGRAGRDGKSSDCVLFYTFGDAVKIDKMLRNPNSNDPTRDKPSDAEIERQISKLQGVVAFCSNESDCRRVLLLRHFDEEFQPEDCHNQCDNCHQPGTLVQHDFTTEAQQLIQLLQQMMTVNSRGVTQAQLKDTWKGKNNKTVQPYKGLSLYASGKALSHPTVERIFTHLANESVISMFRVQCSSGYSNTYIQPGNGAQEYLDGSKKLVLSWKEKEEESRAPTRRAAAQPASRRKGKVPEYASLYEDIEDPDETSDFVGLKDAINAVEASQPSTSAAPQASASHATPGTYEDEISARLSRLQETRRKIADQRSKYPLDSILQDYTLEMLALTPPKDPEEFKSILRDAENPADVEDKWHSFGIDFFAALNNACICPMRTSFDTAKMRRDFAFTGA